MPSSQAVHVRFDRPMDRASVNTRFHVLPSVAGSVSWVDDRDLVYQHAPFSPTSTYQVVLDPGYRDAGGNTNPLRHSWTFQTEGPPALTGGTPANGDRGVDPATYITLTFSREMDMSTLQASVTIAPAAPFAIQQDPGDPLRVTLAPQSLLAPRTTYSVVVTQDARDVDGNRVAVGSLVSFTTGDFRPLRHWIGFIAQPSSGAAGDGVWVVNEGRFPRRLVDAPVSAFSWSSDGSRLLLHSPGGTWTDQALDGGATTLSIQGDWAAFLAPGGGYAFLDRGNLQLLQPDGKVVQIASGVREAAVAPDGTHLALVVGTTGRGSRIDGYDTRLHARYPLQTESGAIDGVSWAPDALGLAYRLDTGDPLRRQVKVRSLRDGGVQTLATGAVSAPVWQADRQHVFFTAAISTPDGTVTKAFRFGVGDPTPRTLSLATGMPSAAGMQVQALSPSADGHQVAFLSNAGGLLAVWLMNADGTGLTELTQYDANHFPYACSAVGWTPT